VLLWLIGATFDPARGAQPVPDPPSEPTPAVSVDEQTADASGGLATDQAQASSVAGDGVERGLVSWYGARFKGRRTACGGRFDPKAMTLAHPSLACGTKVKITNPANGRTVQAVVTDRGPFVEGRIADVSRAVAHKLGIGRRGSAVMEIAPVAAQP